MAEGNQEQAAGKVVAMTVRISPGTHRRIRMYAADKWLSMSAAIEGLLTAGLDQAERPEGKPEAQEAAPGENQ